MIETVFLKAGKIILNVLASLLSFTCIYPIIWMICSSVKASQEFALDTVSFPASLHFENYIQALREGNITPYFADSD